MYAWQPCKVKVVYIITYCEPLRLHPFSNTAIAHLIHIGGAKLLGVEPGTVNGYGSFKAVWYAAFGWK